eukprot:4763032-Prymnesium_polylepis.1
MVAGALVALAVQGPSPPQFVIVECPVGVKAGDAFEVELSGGAGFLGARARRLTVMAPPGIAEGQTFFVPLVKRPIARAPEKSGGEKKKSKTT